MLHIVLHLVILQLIFYLDNHMNDTLPFYPHSYYILSGLPPHIFDYKLFVILFGSLVLHLHIEM